MAKSIYFTMKNSSLFLIMLVLFLMSDRSYSQIAKGQEKFLGNILGSKMTSDFGTYWNQVTPENAGKWGNVETGKDVFVWDTLDMIYKYAMDNKIPFKLHNLVHEFESLWFYRSSNKKCI